MSWGPIQSGARGFLALLGLKSNGALPELLSAEVRPVLNMDGWYLRDQSEVHWRTSAGAFGAAASGFIAPDRDQFAAVVGTLAVPGNEMWYLHEATTHIVSGVSAAFMVLPSATAARQLLPGAVEHLDLADAVSANMTFTAAAQRQLTLNTLRDRWLYPGASLGAFIGGVQLDPAVPYEVTTSARFTRVPI